MVVLRTWSRGMLLRWVFYECIQILLIRVLTPRINVDLIDVEHELFELPQKASGFRNYVSTPSFNSEPGTSNI